MSGSNRDSRAGAGRCTADACCCGCCDDPELRPARHENPPGLAALDYRVGTWATFRERLQWGLSRQRVDGDATRRPLARLATRDDDDLTIALLDAAAVLGDVLTFYQERIANEHYLRTATERRSVLELARAIGYELAPGVSAETMLAFTVEDAPGAPGSAVVPAGTRVKSVPGPGELPQTFETAAELVAHADLNRLRPRRSRPQRLAVHVRSSTVQLVHVLTDSDIDPASVPLHVPAAELFPLDETDPLAAADASGANVPVRKVDTVPLAGVGAPIAAGDRLLAVGRRGDTARTLVLVVVDVLADSAPVVGPPRTIVHLDVPAPPPAPPTRVRLPHVDPVALGRATALDLTTANAALLDRAVDAAGLGAVLATNRWARRDVAALAATGAAARPSPSGPARAGAPGLYAFRQRVGMFGAAAPVFASLPVPDPAPPAGTRPDWDATPGWPINRAYPSGSHPEGISCFLERPVRDIGPRSWVVLESAGSPAAYQVERVVDRATTGFTLAARATGLTLADPDGTSATLGDGFTIRSTTAAVASVRLTPADLVVDDPVESPAIAVTAATGASEATDAATGATALALDGFHPALVPGARLAVHGEQLDAPGVGRDEVVTATRVVHQGGVTFVEIDPPLRYRYRRDTVHLNANVVSASHGETVVEVLGGGDATQTLQRFRLRRPPLTHLPSTTSTSAVPAVEVRVDGVLWRHVETFVDAGPHDRCHLVRIDDDGSTWVVFGDGERGARLPTGSENVVATYRTGTGLPGLVGAGSLTILDVRPLGVRSVANPIAASGAEAPEQLDDARANAPRHVATFDRIVSRRDAELVVRSYPGVGKADAAVLRVDGRSTIVVATATATMQPIDEAPALRTRLLEALAAMADPTTVVYVVGFTPRLFDLTAGLVVDPAYRFDDVAAAATAALAARFDPTRRRFAQPVTASEVLATLAGVAGVVGVDLDQLAFAPAPPAAPDDRPPPILRAAGARVVDGGVVGPDLLVLDPLGVRLHRLADDRTGEVR